MDMDTDMGDMDTISQSWIWGTSVKESTMTGGHGNGVGDRTRSSTHSSSTHSPIHPFTTHSPIHSIGSFIRCGGSTHSLTHSIDHSLVQLFIHCDGFIHSIMDRRCRWTDG